MFDKSLIGWLGILLITLLSISATMTAESEEHILTANNDFAKNMYNVLAKGGGNILFSPISAHSALSMVYQGADGSTKTKFEGTLQVKDPSTVADGYDKVITTLNNVQDVALIIANKVYVDSKFKLTQQFADAVTKGFHSEAQAVDFSKPDAALAEVNGWVKDKTKGKITELLEQNHLVPPPVSIVLNAIYFKGEWKNKFEARYTRPQPFFLGGAADKKTDVPMMSQSDHFGYKEDSELDAKVLELPYKNEDFNLVIVLPNKNDGIADLEHKIAGVDLRKITEGSQDRFVEVSIPKFKIEQKLDLKGTLTEMGLGEIFDADKCNLSKMIEDHGSLYVSAVIQKAFIEVNEEGSEAAAATGAVIGLGLAAPPAHKEIFNADHPFMFLLTFKNSVLFMGTYGKV